MSADPEQLAGDLVGGLLHDASHRTAACTALMRLAGRALARFTSTIRHAPSMPNWPVATPSVQLAAGKPDPRRRYQVAKEQTPAHRPATGRMFGAEDLSREELRQLAKATRKLESLDSTQADGGRRAI